jgi:peptide/nickel transport system substrate-binding protein
VRETKQDAVHEETVPGHSVFLPAMDLNVAPFNDERVRRAMSLAHDRETVLEALYRGLGIPGWGVPWAFAQDEPWSQEQLPWARFDPDEANRLLSAAGHEGFETQMIFFAYSEVMESHVQLFQADMLANLGVNIRLSPMEYAGWFETFADRHDWTGMAWGFQIGTSSTTDEFMYQNMHSTSPGNHYYINDPQIDDLTDRIRREPDLEARRDMVRQVHEIDQDMVYRLPSPGPSGHALIDPRFRNWQPSLLYRGNVTYGSSALTQHWFAES